MSLRLLLIGSILGAVSGVAVGVWGAVRHHRFSDQATTVLSFLILSTPVFLLAVLLKLGALEVNEVAGQTVLYNTGEVTPGLTGGLGASLLNRLQHLVLPTFSIVLGGAVGLGLASLIIAQGDPTGGMLPIYYLPPRDLVFGIALVIVLGLATGLLPAVQAARESARRGAAGWARREIRPRLFGRSRLS